MGGNLNSGLVNFSPLFGQSLIMSVMNCLSHAIDYSRIHY
jgi:hypothetical protein